MLRTLWELAKETWNEFSDDNAALMASGLAYYTLFSIGPILLLVMWFTGMIVGPEVARDQIFPQVNQFVGPGAGSAVTALIQGASRSTSGGAVAAAVAFGLLLFGASQVFAQLQAALNQVWDVPPTRHRFPGLVKKRMWSFLLVFALGLLLIISFILSAVVGAMGRAVQQQLPVHVPLVSILDQVITFLVTAMLFATIFKVLPDKRIAWADVISGALVSAALFVIGKYFIATYMRHSSMASAYGAVGSILVLLLWIGYSAQIFFLGVEWTQVFARRRGSWQSANRHRRAALAAG